ncbi:MAG TPA: PmoA family protein, partial [Longimicrobiales bacterium]
LLPGAAAAQKGRSAAAAAPDAPRVQVVRKDADRRVDVLVDGQPFTSYIYPETIKKPVLYPIRSADGTVVTRGFPLEARPGERVDHPHQVGFWLTHENVNGIDFWNNSTARTAEEAPKLGTILHKSVRTLKSGRGAGELEVSADWVDYRGKILLHEDTRYVFRAAAHERAIDRTTTLTAADEAVTLGDAKDGMLGLRVRRELEQPADKPEIFTDAAGRQTAVPVLNNEGVTGSYHSSEGLDGDAVWGTRGRWASLSGTVQGKPITLAILDNPRNPGFPTYWHARGYGLFAANPLGQKVFDKTKEQRALKLAPHASTTFRYRLLVLDGATSPAELERKYREFAR